MGPGVIGLLLFLVITVIWVLVIKRDIGEGMIISLLLILFLQGSSAPKLLWEGLTFSFTSDVIFAAIVFVFTSHIIEKGKIAERLIDILNSILGRIPGSAGYVATIGQAVFGMISGSGSANQAAVGSITIPWMVRTGFKKESAVAISAGNSGFNFSFPVSFAMLILLGFAPVAAEITEAEFFVALMVGGTYQLIYRLFVIFHIVRKDGIKPAHPDDIKSMRESLSAGWETLLIFLGILIPVVLTIGPIAELFKANERIGEAAIGSISIMVWVPLLVLFISIFIGRDNLPNDLKGWAQFIRETAPLLSTLSIVIIAAFTVSSVLNQLGLAQDLATLIGQYNFSSFGMVLIIGALIGVCVGPLSGTATTTMLGLFAYTSLRAVGVPPAAAVVAICMFVSTEGATPPSTAQTYVAAGMAGSNPVDSFGLLIKYYVIVPLLIGCLIAWGILPLPY